MDRDTALAVLLQLFYLRWRAVGRIRQTTHVPLREIVAYLEIETTDALDLLELLMTVDWVRSIVWSQDNVPGVVYVITDRGRHVARSSRAARRRLPFDA